MRLGLAQIGFSNDTANDYLPKIVTRCRACHASSLFQFSSQVLLLSMSSFFDDVFCTDDKFPADQAAVHLMNFKSRLYALTWFDDLSLTTAVQFLHIYRPISFCPPALTQYDVDINLKLFK